VTYEERERVVSERVDTAPPPAYTPASSAAVTHRTVEYRPSGLELARRIITLIFALILGLIALRIVLLLVAAREGNGLVSFVYTLSEVFVAPFRGILRIDEVDAGVSSLDIAAVVAIVGWAIIYVIILAILNLGRREPTT
jgi:hypothetical protein